MTLRKVLRPLVSGALALALVLPAPALAAWYPEKEHLAVDYADMACTGFDDAVLSQALTSLTTAWERGTLDVFNAHARVSVQSYVKTILEEYDKLETQYYLLGILRDADVTDPSLGQELLDFTDTYYDLSDRCSTALSLLVGTPYEDVLARYVGEEGVEALAGYLSSSEEELDLAYREEELIQAYTDAMAQEFRVTMYGRSWTFNSLYEDVTLSDEEYYAVLSALEKAENEAAGPIFLELVGIRARQAQLAGYDSYARYIYESFYDRDYTLAEAAGLREAVKEAVLPLYYDIYDLTWDDVEALYDLPAATGEEIWAALGPCLKDLDGELYSTYQFMMDHHLYDVEASPTKSPTGYTVPLAQYGSAFIFNDPYESWQDYSTLIHEFGHFNETFHATGSGLTASFRIDVGEIHSQGLEALFTAYGEDLFPGNGTGFTWATLLNLVDSVLEGCMYDEFEAAVLADPGLTLEEVNALFRTISEEYGYYYDEGEEACFWVENSHLFQQPFYYISYATSALSALDLWLTAQTDRDKAVDTYLELSALSMTKPYCQTVRDAGLGDIFAEGTVETLAAQVGAALKEDYGALPASVPVDAPTPRPSPDESSGDKVGSLRWIIRLVIVAAIFEFIRRKANRAVDKRLDPEDPWNIKRS